MHRPQGLVTTRNTAVKGRKKSGARPVLAKRTKYAQIRLHRTCPSRIGPPKMVNPLLSRRRFLAGAAAALFGLGDGFFYPAFGGMGPLRVPPYASDGGMTSRRNPPTFMPATP